MFRDEVPYVVAAFRRNRSYRPYIPVAAARDELSFFYTTLFGRNPALIGGRMPDAAFYGGGQ